MRLSLYQFRTRYRPSLFPVIQEPKAHQVGQADCVFLCTASVHTDAVQKTADRALSACDLRGGAFVPGIGMNDVAV
ncbi:hypothetical protein, partial [Enterobacter hormaechei]|uniref:hypothetical protein n=1 Tax=Enterobacter hormaechei TaxID=158836 RepID=UPI001B876605